MSHETSLVYLRKLPVQEKVSFDLLLQLGSLCLRNFCLCVISQRGSKRTGHGTNSASRLLSTCFECMDSMLRTTRSKPISSATSPITAAGRFPSPSLSTNVKSLNPPAKNGRKLWSEAGRTYLPCVYSISSDTNMQYLLHQQHHLILSMMKGNQRAAVNLKTKEPDRKL